MRAARDGANVVIAAKTVEPHPKLEGTIHTAARDVVAMGGNALPLALDVRDAEAIEAAVEMAGRHFGGIDICINNASAINLGDTRQVDAKRFDLMHQVNARAAYLVSRACMPWLIQSRAVKPRASVLEGTQLMLRRAHLAGTGVASNCCSHVKLVPTLPMCCTSISASAGTVAVRAQSRCSSEANTDHVRGTAPACTIR